MSPSPFSLLLRQCMEQHCPEYPDLPRRGSLLSTTEQCVKVPAPEIACIVTALTFANGPNLSCNAFNGTTSPVVLQLALVTMNPRLLNPYNCRCDSRRGMICEVLTTGTTKGT